MTHFLSEIEDTLFTYIRIYNTGEWKKNKVGFKENYFSRVLFIVKQIIKNHLNLFSKDDKNNSKINNKKWTFILTFNNYKALSFLNNDTFVHVSCENKKTIKGLESNKSIVYLSFTPHFRHNFVWVYYYIQLILKKKKNRIFFILFPHLFYLAYISFVIFRKHLEDNKPKIIVFSNDLNIETRAVNIMARDLGIPTVYVQHATVTKNFPPLNFDLSLLEGQYALEVYRKGSNTEVKLIGQPKFEEYKKQRKYIKNIKTIGVAFNTIDDLELLRNLCIFIINNNYQVILRPHPGELRDNYKSWKFVKRISLNEDSYSFLEKIDLLIAADSSIHLEAVMLNIPSVYYNMNNFLYLDYYSYVKNEVVKNAKRLEDIIRIIKEYERIDKKEIFKLAEFYCHSVDENINSVELSLSYINELTKY